MKVRLREEGEELDRRIDLVNVVFGAALGGYIGVVMTQRDLDAYRGLVLSLVLIIVVCLLVAVRNLIHVLRGTKSGSWRIPVLIFGLATVFFAAIRGDTYLDIGVLLPIAIGWLFAFVIVVSSHAILCKDAKHERTIHH
ncbi:MAG TPA: hypothetical protein VM308_08670 [Sphingomicrobium sp.]|nr:hypothetical protein [Sphingomicrobium sp.]